MKTLKITEETHKQLLELQSCIYTIQGIKYTFNELIAWAASILLIDQKTKFEANKNEDNRNK